jgi:hypothetical protein
MRIHMTAIRSGLLALLLALPICGCSGPRPEVTKVRLLPPERKGEPYRIEATIRNRGGGEGEASVDFRLRDRESGQTYQKQETVELKAHEVTHLSAMIHAPSEADYEPIAEARYPPG